MNQTGGEKKKKTTKTTKTSSSKKTTKSTKPSSKKTSSSKTTKPRSKKGGNFLGSVGDLVAPTGWGSFTTAAGLLALGGLDSTYRKGSKKEKTGEVKKMKGGDCGAMKNKSILNTIASIKPGNYSNEIQINGKWVFKSNQNLIKENTNMQGEPTFFNEYNIQTNLIRIICDNGTYKLQLLITCGNPVKTETFTNPYPAYHFTTKEEAHTWASQRINQLKFIKNCLHFKELFSICKNT